MISTPRRARRLVGSALAAVVLLGVAGCSADEPAPAAPSEAPSAPTTTAAPGPKRTPKATLPPPATTPVPQRSPGDVRSEVPTQPQKTQRPVPLDKRSDAGGGVSARITDLRSIEAKANGPGEVAGPALALTVRVDNGSKSRLDLNQVVVTLTGADGSPGGDITSKPARPLTGQLPAGRSARGVYVFTLDKGNRDPISVAVTLSGGGTVLQYTGKA